MTDPQAANALLTEHLHYTPLTLIDDIINSINNLIYQGISSLETGLLSQPPSKLGFKSTPPNPPNSNTDATNANGDDPVNVKGVDENDLDNYPDAKLEIENGLHQLETLLESTVDKNFDKLEIYVLRNILTVPEDLVGWVRLGRYENLTLPTPSNIPTPESLLLLRRKLHESQKLHHALLDESRRNDALITQLRSMLSGSQSDVKAQTVSTKIASKSSPADAMDLSFLNSPASATAGAYSLTTNTTFTLSQLPTLRATLAALRPRLANLPQTTSKMELDERAMERKEYIDNGAKKGMQRVEGRNGGGEMMQVQGPRRDKAEVEALERMLGTREGKR